MQGVHLPHVAAQDGSQSRLLIEAMHIIRQPDVYNTGNPRTDFTTIERRVDETVGRGVYPYKVTAHV